MNGIPLGDPAPPSPGGSSVGAVVRRLTDLLEPGPDWCGRADARIADVVIAEPGEPLDGPAGALVLAVGARGAEAVTMVAEAAAAGASAVAVRVEDGSLPAAVRAAADAAGVAVLGVPAGLRWDRAAAETRAALAQGHGEGVPERGGDLFSLAQTVATLTRGVVSIEDAAHRVVAYAGSGDEADELRRRSVLDGPTRAGGGRPGAEVTRAARQPCPRAGGPSRRADRW
ncbi:hypothetical protein ACFW2D_16020 [Streptomyces sp. NPDC058914]|uniref:hypothetical protein n=1 Tax=Streptomyces sp. NPDC058914 TaxID=3346671 RepID=UPI003676FD1A